MTEQFIDFKDADLPQDAREALQSEDVQRYLKSQIEAGAEKKFQLSASVTESINEYNGRYPDTAVAPGTETWFHKEASRFFADQQGQPDAKWIGALRQRPEFASMFKTPGAGSNGRKLDSESIAQGMAGSIAERQVAISAKFPNLPNE